MAMIHPERVDLAKIRVNRATDLRLNDALIKYIEDCSVGLIDEHGKQLQGEIRHRHLTQQDNGMQERWRFNIGAEMAVV